MIWKIHIPPNSIEKIDLVSLKISKDFDRRMRALIGVDKIYVDSYQLGIISTKKIWDTIIVSFVDVRSRDELYDILISSAA